MNASLPTLPILTASVDAAALAQGDIPLNQQLGASSNGFGPLLQQAVGALGGSAEPPAASPQGLDALSQQLQGLPQGGKLLPLLQQVLNAAAAGGTDAHTVFKDLAARLEQLSADTDLDPTQAIATAIQQFVDDNPRVAALLGPQLATSVDNGLLRGISGLNTPVPVGEPAVHPLAGAISHTLPAAPTHTTTGVAIPEKPADVSQQQPMTGLDKLAGELLPVTPDQREAVLSEAISLFRRLASSDKAGGSSQGLLRSDSVLTTALSPATAPTPAATAPSPVAPGTHGVSINVPFNQAGWDRALGERIQWMVGKGIQNANIKLNPAHLGPMEVRIQVQHDQASVQFTSVHGVVRDALEAALPRLRDMFDSSGVQLTDVDVSGQSFAEQQAAADGQGGAAGNGGRNVGFEPLEDAEIILETPVYLSPQSGRLDLFA